MKNEKIPAAAIQKYDRIKEKERNMLAAYGEKEIMKQISKKPPVQPKSRERRINQDLIHLDQDLGEKEPKIEIDHKMEQKPEIVPPVLEKPPLSAPNDPGRALVKRLNAERKAREKKKAEAEKAQQEKFKEELENKKR